jgi:hypothetical protein
VRLGVNVTPDATPGPGIEGHGGPEPALRLGSRGRGVDTRPRATTPPGKEGTTMTKHKPRPAETPVKIIPTGGKNPVKPKK